MKTRAKWRLYLPGLLILATLIFIWSNSVRGAVASNEQSEAVNTWFRTLFDITREPFRFLYENSRKVAHFLEFALLGGEVAFLSGLNGWCRIRQGAVGLLFCSGVAIVDETIQLFSPGRVASFADVALDTAGALTGLLFVCLVIRLCHAAFAKK